MKNFLRVNNFLAIGLFAGLALFSSCSEDETTPDLPTTDGKVTVGDVVTEMSDGFIFDYGGGEGEFSGVEYNHYNYDFYVTDGAHTFVDGLEITDYTLELYFELFSPGKDMFREGTFTFADESEEILDKYFISSADATMDFDGNGTIEEAERSISLVSGTVVVAKDGDQYIITVDGVLENEVQIKGGYKGVFPIYRES